MSPRQGYVTEIAADEEILDRKGLPILIVRRALEDLNRVNGLLLGSRALITALHPRIRRLGRSPQWILDIGSGAGDSLWRLRQAAARGGIATRAVSLDLKLSHLLEGRRRGWIGSAVVADSERLPFAGTCFDWTVSSLFFHHLDEVAAVDLLRSMRGLARVGVVVVDLRPSRMAELFVRWVFPLLRISLVGRHDGLLSVRRSAPLSVWRRRLAAEPGARVRRGFPLRLVATIDVQDAASAAQSAGAGSGCSVVREIDRHQSPDHVDKVLPRS